MLLLSHHRHDQLHTIDFTLGADTPAYSIALRDALQSLVSLTSLYIDCEGHRLLPYASPNDISIHDRTWHLGQLRRITLTDVAGNLPILRLPQLRSATFELRAPLNDGMHTPLTEILLECSHLRELELVDEMTSVMLMDFPSKSPRIVLLELPSQLLSLTDMLPYLRGWPNVTRLVMGCAPDTGDTRIVDIIVNMLPLLCHLTLHNTGPPLTTPDARYPNEDILKLLNLSWRVSPPSIIHASLEELKCDTFVDDNDSQTKTAALTDLISFVRRCPSLHTLLCDPLVMASPTCGVTVSQWLALQKDNPK
jgi:hypothetical protein